MGSQRVALMMRPITAVIRSILIGTVLITMALLFSPQRAEAMPMFARKYHLKCEQCHTIMPRLTNFGYAFYRAGFRLPGHKKYPLTFSNSASLMTEMMFTNSNPAGNTGFDMSDTEIQVLTAIGEHFSTHLHYVFPGSTNGAEIHQAWVQYNTAPTGAFWSFRAGQFSPIIGFRFGGDRNWTITDAQLYGTLPGQERGVDVGYTDKGLTTHLSWLNGVDASAVDAIGSGRQALSGHRAQDYMLQSEYEIGKLGSSIGGLYYHGVIPGGGVYPYTTTSDIFNRSAIYGNWATVLKSGSTPGIPDLSLDINGGALWGHDDGGSGPTGNTYGSLLELDLNYKHRSALAMRYDNLNGTGQPTIEEYTFDAAHLINNHVLLRLEYNKIRKPSADQFTADLWFFY